MYKSGPLDGDREISSRWIKDARKRKREKLRGERRKNTCESRARAKMQSFFLREQSERGQVSRHAMQESTWEAREKELLVRYS